MESDVKKAIICSACLVGEKCRYDGSSNENEKVLALGDKYRIIPVCPETSGGLGTPRTPSEIKCGRVYTKDGKDVTEYFVSGAKTALQAAEENKAVFAVLKARSPSCGSGFVYDGSFSGKLTAGDGIFAGMLKKAGIAVFSEETLGTAEDFAVDPKAFEG